MSRVIGGGPDILEKFYYLIHHVLPEWRRVQPADPDARRVGAKIRSGYFGVGGGGALCAPAFGFVDTDDLSGAKYHRTWRGIDFSQLVEEGDADADSSAEFRDRIT